MLIYFLVLVFIHYTHYLLHCMTFSSFPTPKLFNKHHTFLLIKLPIIILIHINHHKDRFHNFAFLRANKLIFITLDMLLLPLKTIKKFFSVLINNSTFSFTFIYQFFKLFYIISTVFIIVENTFDLVWVTFLVQG